MEIMWGFCFCSLNWNNYFSNHMSIKENTALAGTNDTAAVPAHDHTKLHIHSSEASPFLPNWSPDWLPFNHVRDKKALLDPTPELSPPGHLLSLLCGQQDWDTGRAGSRVRHFPCSLEKNSSALCRTKLSQLVLELMPGPKCKERYLELCSCSFMDISQNMLLFTNYREKASCTAFTYNGFQLHL